MIVESNEKLSEINKMIQNMNKKLSKGLESMKI